MKAYGKDVVGEVYVVMTERNGYKNILSVWSSYEEAMKVKELVRDGYDSTYVMEMPVWENVKSAN